MEKDHIFCMNCGQELPPTAKFCLACGQRIETGSRQDVEEDASETIPCLQEDMSGPAESSGTLVLAEFRRNAPSMTGFREALLSYRKSLPNNWDYNAFVGILLGVGGPKHGDAACMNFAIGQGDNGQNTRKTLEVKELMSVFEKYKGKNISPSILLSDVEEEIIAIAPEYAAIRDKFHDIVFAGTSGEVRAAKAVSAPQTPAPAETKDPSEVIDFIVEILAQRVLAHLKGEKNTRRPDITEKLQKWNSIFWLHADQQEFEANFGTSAEAKWLYSAREIIGRAASAQEFHHDYYLYDLGKIDEAVSMLQKLPEGKYGIAYYALARCYGVGIDTLIKGWGNESDRVYVLRPDYAKMNQYLTMAVEAQRPEKEPYIDAGHFFLSLGDYTAAKSAFTLAQSFGLEKASIYLRYIEQCEHAIPAINGQRMAEQLKIDDTAGKQYIYGNTVEYKGRIYWMCEDRQRNDHYSQLPVMLCSLGADGKRTVLAEMKPASWVSLNMGMSASAVGLAFSICNDLIYYENGSGGISTMRLDGSDKRELPDLTNNGKTTVHMPMAFPRFLLYTSGSGGTIWKRDQNGVKIKVGTIKDRIVGVSEREINIANKVLIDLRTLEKRKVTQKYPALKGKTVFYIDMAREIAYYLDHTDTGEYRDRRLIGVNTRGEIVDYWEMPLMPYDYHGSGYYSFCFNGQRLSNKASNGYVNRSEEYMELWKKQGLSEREWPYIALFDRKGNRLILCVRKDEDSMYTYGGYHMMTENGIVVLEYHGKEWKWWNTYYSFFNNGIPPAMLDFFT